MFIQLNNMLVQPLNITLTRNLNIYNGIFTYSYISWRHLGIKVLEEEDFSKSNTLFQHILPLLQKNISLIMHLNLH